MSPEDFFLRLASTVPAALGAWAGVALLLGLFRVRDATLRGVVWTWAALTPPLVVAGLPAGGIVLLRLVVPRSWPPFRDGVFAPSMLVLWAAVAAALVLRRAARGRRTLACAEAIAAASCVPDDVADAVRRAADWMGVARPAVAAAETDGTAFVVGARSPVLFVPLALWRRLDVRARRAMLLHEMAHVRRRDVARLAALSYLVDLLWPALPLRWTAARLRDAWEAQADQEAVHGGATRSALARSLIEAWAAPAPAGVLAFGGGSMRKRLAALRRRPGLWTLTLQVALLVTFLPWWPGWGGWGVACRMERCGDRERGGVVAVGLACRNPLVGLLAGHPAAGRGVDPLREPRGSSRSEKEEER